MTTTTILYITGVIAGALAVLLWDGWRIIRNARRDRDSAMFKHTPAGPRGELERKADHARRIH